MAKLYTCASSIGSEWRYFMIFFFVDKIRTVTHMYKVHVLDTPNFDIK